MEEVGLLYLVQKHLPLLNIAEYYMVVRLLGLFMPGLARDFLLDILRTMNLFIHENLALKMEKQPSKKMEVLLVPELFQGNFKQLFRFIFLEIRLIVM
jgi:hypothetical protein